jgi:hypothetical protein
MIALEGLVGCDMAIQDFYTTLELYRQTDFADNWGNTSKKGNYTLVKEFQGFLQYRGGDFTQQNQANIDTKTAILYTDLGQGIIVDDIIKQNTDEYQVRSIQEVEGIAGVKHHQEVILSKNAKGQT